MGFFTNHRNHQQEGSIMGQFTTTPLTGNRVLVEGTDRNGYLNKTVLDSTEWDGIKAEAAFKQGVEAFDQAVEEFFQPLTTAAEALTPPQKPEDPASYVVLQEAVSGQPEQPGVLVQLSHDSIVLRLIEAGTTDRLIWVGDTLEVTAEAPQPVVRPFD